MTRTWVALLYSIELGGGRRVRNAELLRLAEALGFAAPRALLATGNLLFEADLPDAGAVEAVLEPAFATRLGRAIPIVVRAGDRWPALIDANPFAAASAAQPSRVAVRVMRDPADADVAGRLAARAVEGEAVAVVGGDLWLSLPHGTAGSRLAGAAARIAGAGTFRNWNTVRRIGAALVSGGSGGPGDIA